VIKWHWGDHLHQKRQIKVIKIRKGCQYVGYFYYSENPNWAAQNLRLGRWLDIAVLEIIANPGVQKCGRALAPRDKKRNYFEAGWITCGCICTVRKKEWKDYVDIEYQKLISRRVIRWLSFYRSLPRTLLLYPVSNSYCMSIDKPTVVLKHFFGNSLSELCSH